MKFIPTINTTTIAVKVPNFGGTRARINTMQANREARKAAELQAATLAAFGCTPVVEEVETTTVVVDTIGVPAAAQAKIVSMLASLSEKFTDLNKNEAPV